LNPQENIWQFMRGNWLSNAWRERIAKPEAITSICIRD